MIRPTPRSTLFPYTALFRSFNNAGTLQMTGGVSNNIGVAFNNSGTVSANAEEFSFSLARHFRPACARVLNADTRPTHGVRVPPLTLLRPTLPPRQARLHRPP